MIDFIYLSHVAIIIALLNYRLVCFGCKNTGRYFMSKYCIFLIEMLPLHWALVTLCYEN